MGEDSYTGNLYQRFPVTVERARGAVVWDESGREYIDMMGGYGVAVVGHCNDMVVAAIREQAGRVITVHSSLYNRTREAFLEALAEVAPAGLTGIHLNNSGAESVEAAIKFARKYTSKKGVVAMRGSYHGKSMGALSLTFNPKYRKPFSPLLEGVSFAGFGDIDSVRDHVTGDTGMIIVEPVQGESGIHVAPDGFLRELRELCDERDILLAFDEVQSGLGRTGKMWAASHWDVIPDIMCVAKGVAGGVPLGATLTRPEILSRISKGEHSSTFGGNPLSCAAGKAALDSIVQDDLAGNAGRVGSHLISELNRMAGRHRIIREVRGLGLMIGVEMRFEVREVLHDLIGRGVLMLYSGRNVLRMLPPLVLSMEQADAVLEGLEGALRSEEERRNVR
ncbi:MAG: aminotransferase class III-fold pyridoxal phosphate-dependent enzyme [Nitrosopumilaceae archaeon]|nr:aminotransferase class III-fold pyridoxal phosphate-dependent enzyme [Nitrosopumilaceae archaeon]